MHLKVCLAFLFVAGVSVQAQDLDRDYSGVWTLNAAKSELQSRPASPATVLRIQQRGDTIHYDGEVSARYKTDGSETKFGLGAGVTSSSRTKWEGRSLMISSLVNGPRPYSIQERWTLSRDRNTLRIRRQIVTMHGETESNLTYEREGSAVKARSEETTTVKPAAPLAERVQEPSTTSRELTYTVPAGVRIPLKLIAAVSTKTAGEGDRIYLETAFPVVAEGRLVIPPGSAVAGTVTHVVRPGRVKGRGELFLRFDFVTLPNGTTREFRSRPDSLDGGRLDAAEGKIQSPGSKGEDARKAGQAAGAGAAVGSIAGSAAGRSGMGAGIGAASGAAAGLAGVLLSRGAETVLPRGTVLEMVLDRPIVFLESELDPRTRPR